MEELRAYLCRDGQQAVTAYPARNECAYLVAGIERTQCGTGGGARTSLLVLPGTFSARQLYRRSIFIGAVRISEVLDRPYTMAGIPVIVAETDEEAIWLATDPQQAFLNLIRNRPGPLMPPVKELNWNVFEKRPVEAQAKSSIVGIRETVRRKLEAFLDLTQVDELIVITNAYEHTACSLLRMNFWRIAPENGRVLKFKSR